MARRSVRTMYDKISGTARPRGSGLKLAQLDPPRRETFLHVVNVPARNDGARLLAYIWGQPPQDRACLLIRFFPLKRHRIPVEEDNLIPTMIVLKSIVGQVIAIGKPFENMPEFVDMAFGP